MGSFFETESFPCGRWVIQTIHLDLPIRRICMRILAVYGTLPCLVDVANFFCQLWRWRRYFFFPTIITFACLLRFFFSLSSDKTSSSGTFLYTWIFYKVFVHVFFHSPDGFRKHRIPSIWSARREFQHGKKKKNFLFIFSHLVTALVSPIIIFIIILLSFVVKSVSEKKIMEIGYKNWEWQ